jgi:hypothetical protein
MLLKRIVLFPFSLCLLDNPQHLFIPFTAFTILTLTMGLDIDVECIGSKMRHLAKKIYRALRIAALKGRIRWAHSAQ